MLFYTVGQQYVFLLMAVSGLCMGVWSDLCSALEKAVCAGRLLRLVMDAVCTLGITALLLCAMFFSTRLDFRLYSVGAAALGAAVYRIAVHPALVFLVSFVKNRTRSLLKTEHMKKIKKIFQIICK